MDDRLSGDNPRLTSVLVPVRDDWPGIQALLHCLASQTVDPSEFEVIVIDDGSQAGDPALSAADLTVRVLRQPPRNAYAARNHGLCRARGSVIAFCDSDCRPSRQWLEYGIAALAEADLAAGPILFSAPPHPTIWTLLTVDCYLDQERAVQRGVAATANLFVAREVFTRVGLFDEAYPSGADWAWVSRAVAAGNRLVYEDRAGVHHRTLDTVRALIGKLWHVNRWAGRRRAQASSPLLDLGVRLRHLFLPVGAAVSARRRLGRPRGGMDRRRLGQCGIETTRRQRVLGLLLFYLFILPLIGLAHLYGRLEGRRNPVK